MNLVWRMEPGTDFTINELMTNDQVLVTEISGLIRIDLSPSLFALGFLALKFCLFSATALLL